MKTILATLVLIVSTTAFSADKATDKAAAGPDAKAMAEMMKAFEKYGTPGKEHKMLGDMAGEWTYTSKMWMQADGQPEESSGTASMKMILGGRWLQHESKGTAMGKPFEGMGYTGYDNIKKKYVTIWMDSMSTGLVSGEGTYDAKNKVYHDKGSFTCPITPEKERAYRSEWKILGKNKMVFSMFGANPGETKEFKNMEMTFTRK